MGDRRRYAKTRISPSKKGERYLSPREVKVAVDGILLCPILLGIALLLLTPRDTFLNPFYWIGIGFWSAFGAILGWHEVSRQIPEAEYSRRARSTPPGFRHDLKWVSVALLVLALGLAKLLTGAPPTSEPGAFLSGLAGFWLAMGIGYAYELIGREKLRYCSTCEGHRWYIHYQGQIVCGVCGNTWAGQDKAWVRPSVDSRQRGTNHAILDFFAAGPMITFSGIFGALVLPQIGLAEWVGIPVLMMFGGLVSTIVLGRRFRRQIAELQKS